MNPMRHLGNDLVPGAVGGGRWSEDRGQVAGGMDPRRHRVGGKEATPVPERPWDTADHLGLRESDLQLSDHGPPAAAAIQSAVTDLRIAGYGSGDNTMDTLEPLMTTSMHTLRRRDRRGPGSGGTPVWRALATILAGALVASVALAGKPKPPLTVEEEFGSNVELAPFVVRGQQLAISIHARSKRDRKYAEGFAEDVVKVVHDGVTERTGKGLVIIGAKGEPHPVVIFRKFQEMAEAGQLDPEVAATAVELTAFLDTWKASMNEGRFGDHWGRKQQPADEHTDETEAADSPDDADEHENGHDLEIDVDAIVNALPLPLEGVGARLYQIAWAERFDDAKLTARLRSLKAEELQRDLFVRFDWVFYLPPRGAFDRVLNEFIAAALKKEEMGFFTRAAVKTVLVIAKPFIRRAVEGMRKGVLFMAVVRAQTDYDDGQVTAMMGAYIETMMPGAPARGKGSAHDRAVLAVREALAGVPAAEPGEMFTSAFLAETTPHEAESEDVDADDEAGGD